MSLRCHPLPSTAMQRRPENARRSAASASYKLRFARRAREPLPKSLRSTAATPRYTAATQCVADNDEQRASCTRSDARALVPSNKTVRWRPGRVDACPDASWTATRETAATIPARQMFLMQERYVVAARCAASGRSPRAEGTDGSGSRRARRPPRRSGRQIAGEGSIGNRFRPAPAHVRR